LYQSRPSSAIKQFRAKADEKAVENDGFIARARAWLPRGNTLPHDVWLNRHRWLLSLLAALGVGIFVFALLEGFPVGHSLLEGGILEVFAAAAWITRDQQRLASALASMGLISSASVAIHISGGYIEAHFLFFIVIILLALYEDWLPYLVAAAYVLLHHGYVGLTDPASVYNHPDAIAHPLKWALIHASLVFAAGCAGIVAWRLNENERLKSERAYEIARRSERSMADAQDLAGIGGFEYDLRSGDVTTSLGLRKLIGMPSDDLAQPLAYYLDHVAAVDRPAVEAGLEAAVVEGARFNQQVRYDHPDGTTRVFHVRWEVASENGKPARLIGTSQDVTDRERARDQALRRAEMQRIVAELGELALGATDLERLFHEAVSRTARTLKVDTVLLAELDRDKRNFVVVAEAGLGDLFGVRYPADESTQSGATVSQGHPIVVHDWETDDRYQASEVIQRIGARSSVSVLVRRRDGVFGILGVLSPEPNKFDQDDVNFAQSLANLLSAAIDRVEAEADTRHRALHDPLTGLPNRVLFGDRLQQALASALREGKQVGVLFCDLDQFKLVNDSLGHEAGDELLTMVAPRLDAILRAGDTVGRFGGDEFGIIVAEAETIHDLTRVAERIAAALAAPFVLRDREYFVTASVGIAFGGGGEPPEALIRDADLAMYRAKERGRGRYEIFDQAMRRDAVDHLRTENDLRRALGRDEFLIHYQPVVRLRPHRIVGYEALVRWQHPERGLLGPGEFIPLAEESELIVDIGERVLQLACRQTAEWNRARPDGPPITISVNVSPRQMADPRLPERVRRILRETDLDPLALCLEITESVLVDEAEALDTIRALKELGVRLVLDDFGTGFSALGYLQRFPFDQLKIDRSFVQNLEDPATSAIVSSVISIADALGLAVVAEGIETEAQLETVHSLGCNFAQGFYFAKPLPADAARALIDAPAKIA
jgi:diguanylate cyclase (GGDEF)-like protein